MENNTIIQETSHGSPILAYGSASLSPKRRIVLFITAAILFLAVPFLLILFTFVFGSAELPSHTVLAISVTPSKVSAKIQGVLITELPSPWRAALETQSSLPVIIGLAKTKQGTIAPFAIVPKNISLIAPEHTKISNSSLVKLLSNNEIETSKKSYRSLSRLLNIQKRSDAGWQVYESLLLMISNQPPSDSKDDIPVYGSLSGTRGNIYLPTEETNDTDSTGAFFVILGKNAVQSNNLSNALMTQGIDARSIHDPEYLSLKGDGAIEIKWLNLSEEEKSNALAISGKSTSTSFELPDQELVKLIASDKSLPVDESNKVSIQNSWKQSSGEASLWKTNCPGKTRFSIQGEALQNLLTMLKASTSWKSKIQSFTISTDGKQNIFCINE